MQFWVRYRWFLQSVQVIHSFWSDWDYWLTCDHYSRFSTAAALLISLLSRCCPAHRYQLPPRCQGSERHPDPPETWIFRSKRLQWGRGSSYAARKACSSADSPRSNDYWSFYRWEDSLLIFPQSYWRWHWARRSFLASLHSLRRHPTRSLA